MECFIRLSRRGAAAYLDVETAQQTDRATGRLSGLPRLTKLSCHLAIVERTYGRDAAFLQRHGRRYRRTVRRMRAQLLRTQIAAGQFAAARSTLAGMRSAPLHLRLFLRLGDARCRTALEHYRRVRRITAAARATGPRDDQALELARALVDPGGPDVALRALDGEVAEVAAAAVHLERDVADLPGVRGREQPNLRRARAWRSAASSAPRAIPIACVALTIARRRRWAPSRAW